MWSKTDSVDIASRLRDAVFWCSQHPLYASSFSSELADLNFNSWHSEVLRPTLSTLETEGVLHEQYGDIINHEKKCLIVTEACRRRANLVNAHEWSTPNSLSGTLMAYSPDWTDASGAAPAETCDYFDFADAPPWDVWIALKQNEAFTAAVWPSRSSVGTSWLLFWVPEHLMELVYQGRSVMPCEPIVELVDDELLHFIQSQFERWEMPPLTWIR